MVVAFRYIAKELLIVFIVIFVLLFLVAVGGRFVGFLREAAMGRFTAEAIWHLLILRMPEFVQMTIPFSMFLASLLTLGRMHAEQEFVMFTVGGTTPLRMLSWITLISVPIAVLVALLSMEVSPQSRIAYKREMFDQVEKSEFDTITAGVFHTYNLHRSVTYAKIVDHEKNELRGVFMNEFQDASARSISQWAERGIFNRDIKTGGRYLVLEKGTRYEGMPGEPGYRSIEFERFGQRVQASTGNWSTNDVRTFDTTALDLANHEQAAELHWRIGLPLLALIGVFIAFGMAKAAPRAGRFARIAPGVGVFVGYYLAVVLMKNMIEEGAVAFALGWWAPHALMAILAVILVRRSYRPA